MVELTIPVEVAAREVESPGPILDVSGISLSFGETTAISDVSFGVQAGELFAIIGPNGAGTTTNVNSLSGVARMFQDIELFDNLTVLDNIMLGRHNHLHYSAPLPRWPIC